MTCWSNISTTSDLRGEADGVFDLLLLKHLVVPDQARKDRQARSVCRCPTRRTQRIRIQIEDGAAVRIPTRAVVDWKRVTQFIKLPVVTIYYEYVTISI